MVDPEKIDIERIRKPSARFHLAQWTNGQVDTFVQHLCNDFLYVSDEFRDEEILRQQVIQCISGKYLNLTYEIGQMDGVMSFQDIILGRRCSLSLKLWNGKLWGPDLVGEGKTLIDYVMDAFELVRTATITADPRIVRMAKMVGFEVEGVKRKSFTWNGKLYDETIMAIVR